MNGNALKGKWFLSYHDPRSMNELVKWQGQVIVALPEGMYLVQLYSWISGTPTEQRVVNISGMVDWSFYDSMEDMAHAYQHKK